MFQGYFSDIFHLNHKNYFKLERKVLQFLLSTYCYLKSEIKQLEIGGTCSIRAQEKQYGLSEHIK
jgi:hypothetical protein